MKYSFNFGKSCYNKNWDSVAHQLGGGTVLLGEACVVHIASKPIISRLNRNRVPALSPDIAETFRSGSYTATTLSENTTFYRVYGGNAGKVGSYMSRTLQNGGMQSQIDLALNPLWGNTAEYVTEVVVPKGTTIYEGAAAPQDINGGAGQLLGGGNQVYIPEVDPNWFK